MEKLLKNLKEHKSTHVSRVEQVLRKCKLVFFTLKPVEVIFKGSADSKLQFSAALYFS